MLRGIVCICVLAVAGVAAADAPRMLKGPYLQDLAPTSITVMWQMEPQQAATLVVEGPGGTRTIDVKADRVAEAQIAGLTPSSRYRYRVIAGDQQWQGEFATAPPIGKDVPFSFVVFGDSRYGEAHHRRVVNRMSQEVPDFMLGTGDMVDEGYRQEQWQSFFDIENEMLRDNVYFPALGNHDRQGRGRTADSYRAFFSVPENGNETERYYAFTYATSRFLVLDSNLYSFALTDQTSWLERELIAARQDPAIHHIFVVMHHPPFSISLHGGAVDLRERWTPLFEQYNVTAVFSGHDHVYTRAMHNGLHYFISGGGGAPLYPRRPKSNPIDVAAVKKFERVLHYLRVTITGNRVEVTAVRADGTTIETTSWKDGPEPTLEQPKLSATGAPPAAAATAAPTAPRAKVPPPDDGNMLWIGLGGLVVVLGAAVFVVRSLR
ncbi:MAG TPA: metallophosphoesterase [Kofleriaceae bacterium]|nr:metallophosphoesterase [Kofleriaceae bacterium]